MKLQKVHVLTLLNFLYLEESWVELLSQVEERFGVIPKVVDVEDTLWSGEVVLLEVVIETGARTTKVRNACSY